MSEILLSEVEKYYLVMGVGVSLFVNLELFSNVDWT